MPTELEDRFIRAYFRDHDGGRLANSIATEHLSASGVAQLAEHFGYVAYAYPDFWRVTARGMDLLHTAHAIGYDPDASKPEPEVAPATRECPDCKGRGRVPISELRGRTRTISELLHDEPAEAFVLPGWDVTCTGCNGAKVVPVEYAAGIDFGHTGMVTGSRDPDGYLRIHDEIRINRQAAKHILAKDYSPTPLIWHDPASSIDPKLQQYLAPAALENARRFAAGQSGEWIDFTCLADVEGWEGATIEVRNRDGEHHKPCTLQSASRLAAAYYRVHTSLRSYSSHCGWQFRKLASAALPLPGGSIGYTATATPSTFSFHASTFSFHAAWHEAKARPDYHKPDWNRAQRHHEHECYELSTWLKLVRAAPGRVDIRDADRPAANKWIVFDSIDDVAHPVGEKIESAHGRGGAAMPTCLTVSVEDNELVAKGPTGSRWTFEAGREWRIRKAPSEVS